MSAQLHGVEIFDTRDRLKALLSTYAVDRSSGDLKPRLGVVTWNQHMSVLGKFYRLGGRRVVTQVVLPGLMRLRWAPSCAGPHELMWTCTTAKTSGGKPLDVKIHRLARPGA